MTRLRWDTQEAMRQLLNELVSWRSVTNTEGEKQFAIKFYKKLEYIAYFQKHTNCLALHDTHDDRKFLTALYKHQDAKATIVLISHFDTVDTKEYGQLERLSTMPEALTKKLFEHKNELSPEVWKDLQSNTYLFGRGTMDMKMGIVIHMHLLEKAIVENWPINLLMITVPDEEVNSTGMRAAVSVLHKLQKEFDLDYKLFLNSEPVLGKDRIDDQYSLYTGSIGKVLPAALFYGKETHAGQPFRGITSPYIASFLTREMEWNPLFTETVYGETTPAPVILQQTDLELNYSTQTPYRSSALYNVFMMKRNAKEVFDLFEQVAIDASEQCNTHYHQVCKKNGVAPLGQVKVIRYEKLVEFATKKHGEKFIEQVRADIVSNEEWDDREKSLHMANQLMVECQELAPAIVIMYAPPFYPAVNSTGDELVEYCSDFVIRKAKEKFNLQIERTHYFNGISDLSYVNYNGDQEGWADFVKNTPLFGDQYYIPFEEMQALNAPVINIGPYGHDAHKRTERLHVKNAFEEVPYLLRSLLEDLIKNGLYK